MARTRRPRVFRFRRRVGGRPMWYALSPSGVWLAARVVGSQDDETAIVAELIEIAQRAERPMLELVR